MIFRQLSKPMSSSFGDIPADPAHTPAHSDARFVFRRISQNSDRPFTGHALLVDESPLAHPQSAESAGLYRSGARLEAPRPVIKGPPAAPDKRYRSMWQEDLPEQMRMHCKRMTQREND